MHFANHIIDAITTPSITFNNNNNYSNNYNNNILLPTLEERLQAPLPALPSTLTTALTPLLHTLPNATVVSSSGSGGGGGGGYVNSSSISTIGQIASIVVSNFRSPPTTTAQLPATTITATSTIIIDNHLTGNALNNTIAPTHSQHYQQTSYYPTFNPPAIESLVASSAEEFGNNFHDLSFDVFDDSDNNLFGSPLSFDASENGLWNGRFVPPPPRPSFFVDETVLNDGLTTCDLCSWAIPTKSTFIFESSMEKASELGWPLTLTIVSILSALLGAIIMITVVKCRRKKSSQQRTGKCFRNFNINKIQQQQSQEHPIIMSNLEQNNDDLGTRLETQQLKSLQSNGISRKCIQQQQQQQQQHTTMNNLQERYTHVQWWSRNKRPNGNNNHLRRSNIYTAHPADSIRGLQTNALPATATVVGMLGDAVPVSLSAAVTQMSLYHSSSLQQQLQQQHDQQQQQSKVRHQLEHEYHQPQDLEMTLTQQNQHQSQQQHCHVAQHHQHEHSSSSISSSSTTTSSPSMLSNVIEQQQQQPQQPQQAQQQVQCLLHKPLQITKQILLPENVSTQPVEHQHQLQQLQYHKQQHQQQLLLQQSSASELHDNLFHWPTATTLVTS